MLGPAEGDRGILATRIYSDGRYAEQLYSPGGGTRIPPTAETLAAGASLLQDEGQRAVQGGRALDGRRVARGVGGGRATRPKTCSLFIPHQANQRITDAVADKLKVDGSIVYSNIAMHGNTSSASIPIALDECVEQGRVNEGDLVLLASFGGGVTWGGVLVKW